MKYLVLLSLLSANLFAQNVNHQCSIELTTKGFKQKSILAKQVLFNILDNEDLDAKAITFKYKGKNYKLDLEFEFNDPNYIYIKSLKSSYLKKLNEGSFLVKELKSFQFNRELLISTMLNQTYGSKTFSGYGYSIAQSLQSEGDEEVPSAAVFTDMAIKRFLPFAKKFELTINCNSSY